MIVDASLHFKQILKELPHNGNEHILIKRFLNNVIQHYLPDESYSIFPGKLSESWANLEENDPLYVHAKQNHLHHYHIGHTCYWKTTKKYKTSEWVLHFIWDKNDRSKSNEIKIVDYTPHKVNGEFPIPRSKKLI